MTEDDLLKKAMNGHGDVILEDKTTLTVAHVGIFQVGDRVIIEAGRSPWWVRLWRWVTRYKPPTYGIVGVKPWPHSHD